MQRKALFLFVLLWMAACHWVWAQKKDLNSYIRVPDIKYASHPKSDPKLNMLDVYMPKKGSNSPVLIWIHGGALAYGEKEYVQEKAEYFTKKGYVFISINYRLSPKVVHPAHVQDVSDAIMWIHKNAVHYSADADKIFLMGHSTGAHLAALVSTDETYIKKSGGELEIIQGVVLLDGEGYDIPVLMNDAKSRLREWYTQAFGNTKKDWELASPVYFVKAGKKIPAFMIAYAGEREAAEVEAKTLSKKLTEALVENKVFFYQKKSHLTISRDLGEEGDKPTEDVLRFLLEKHYMAVNPSR
jgi:acetyl esterase/lipase